MDKTGDTHWYDQFTKGERAKAGNGRKQEKGREKGRKANRQASKRAPQDNKRGGESGASSIAYNKSNAKSKNNEGINKGNANKRGITKGTMTKSAVVLSVHRLFDSILDEAAQEVLDNFDDIVQSVFPATARQQREGRYGIRGLSHSLTDERGERRRGYMNDAATLSPYARYFVWWNLVRLTRLFKTITDGIQLKDGDTCLDIGSGPATVPIALYLARPELRKKRIRWICTDLSQKALDLGKALFESIASIIEDYYSDDGADEQGVLWQITSIRARVGEEVYESRAHEDGVYENEAHEDGAHGAGERGCAAHRALVTCANVLNELQDSEHLTAEETAQRYGKVLARYAAGGETSDDDGGTADNEGGASDNGGSASEGTLLVIEPGVPPMAHVLSLMREQLLLNGWHVISPCTHEKACPMNGEGARTGGKSKWCNFAFDTADAPEGLRTVSADAGLVKRRAVLSYLLMRKGKGIKDGLADEDDFADSSYKAGGDDKADEGETAGGFRLRIASDPIYLPGYRTGYYACSPLGLALVIDASGMGYEGGDEVVVHLTCKIDLLERDKKTGAVMLYL